MRDPEDSYFFRDAEVQLERVANEVSVIFRAGNRRAHEEVVRRIASAAVLGPDIPFEGRVARTVMIPRGSMSLSLSEIKAALLASDEVVFVGAVYVHPAGSRLLGTDEVVVKLKPTTTREEMTGRAGRLGLSVRAPMLGTTDEFVLRFEPRTASNALTAARALYTSGAFQWVEPNFIRQMER